MRRGNGWDARGHPGLRHGVTLGRDGWKVAVGGEWRGYSRAMSAPPHAPDVRLVDLRTVRVPPWRLRALGDLEALRESIAAAGLLQPIVVDPSLTLVCGAHRLEACRALGWESIPAMVTSLEGPYAQLAEVDENLCRRELTVLERAEHIALRLKLWEQTRPPAAEVAARKKNAKRSEAPLVAFLDDTARRTGRGPAAVREELRIGELPEDVRATARETPIHDNKRELLALTRMPEEEQRRAVQAVRDGEAKSVRKKKPARPRPAPVEGDAGEGSAGGLVAASLPAEEPPPAWSEEGSAFLQERSRADVIRIVGELQRLLARAAGLWSAQRDESGEGRERLDGAVRAVERLARWMEGADDVASDAA
jgi:ParB-like chromosome segregation protein Spo0J